MLIAQISDFHIVEEGCLLEGRVDTAAFLAMAVAQINRLDPLPDLVVSSGDLVESGQPGQYQRLVKLLEKLAVPFLLMPGNHDRRAALRAAFPSQACLGTEGFIQYEHDAGPLRLLCLDTLDEGQSGGRLCPERLAWLKEALNREPSRPVMLFLHHPPFPVGIPFMDRIALDAGDAKALGRLVESHRQIVGMACGHLHRTVMLRWHGVAAMVAPGVAHQIYPDARPDGHEAFIMEPPGLLLHRWLHGTGLVTQVQSIGAFGPPHPYLD